MDTSARFKYIVLSSLFILAAVNLTRTTLDILKSSKRLDNLNAEVNGLKDERNKLEEDISYKSTDDYIEERARDDLSLVKPGEHVYVVDGQEPSKKEGGFENSDVLAELSERIAQDKDFKDSNAYRWYKLFF